MRSTGKVSKYFPEEVLDEVAPALIDRVMREEFENLGWKTIAKILLKAVSQGSWCLQEKCTKYLLASLDLSNVCTLLEFAKEFSVQSLFQHCLKMCADAAFAILDSEDFDQVSPSTVVMIASQPNLNVSDETEVFYSLWTRAIIDCCRNDTNTTYDSISRYFKPYSVCVQFRDVDEHKLRTYNNDKMLRYYRWMMDEVHPQIIFKKRKFRYPEKLMGNFLCNYLATGIETFVKLPEKPYEVKFSVKKSVYVIQIKLAYTSREKRLQKALKHLLLRNDSQIIFREKYPENANLGNPEIVTKTRDCVTHFHEFLYNLKDVVKLHPHKLYSIVIEPFDLQSLWAIVAARGHSYPVEFHAAYIACLTGMKFISSA